VDQHVWIDLNIAASRCVRKVRIICEKESDVCGSWSAIVRGAAIWGLETAAPITNRIARRYYGVEYRTVWAPGDPEEFKKYDDWEMKYYCTKRIQWFIQKVSSSIYLSFES
jgi:hypothetical protein